MDRREEETGRGYGLGLSSELKIPATSLMMVYL